jgi:hypothetical protein
MENKTEWNKKMEKKYKGKTLTPTDLQNERKRLEDKYGSRIMLKRVEDFSTPEEVADKIEYNVLTKKLSDLIPELKKLDDKYAGFLVKEEILHEIEKKAFYRFLNVVLTMLYALAVINSLYWGLLFYSASLTSAIISFLIVLFIGFLIVDFIRIAILYVYSGKIFPQKSLLLRSIAILINKANW